MGEHNFDNQQQHDAAHDGWISPDGSCAYCAKEVITALRTQLAKAKEEAAVCVKYRSDEEAELQREVERLTPQFTGKPDETALHKVKAKCTQLWNCTAIGVVEVHTVLEFIHRHACDAEREVERLKERGRKWCEAYGEAGIDIDKLKADNERLREALEFYADPETYFAVAFMADRPCGEFADDRSEVTREIDGQCVYVPGQRARTTLAQPERIGGFKMPLAQPASPQPDEPEEKPDA